ncbi:MAG: MBL fold metallo-hydrolase [Promethearchaeota archaeon]
MVKIKFLGACMEIGRSGILIESEKTNDRILLDYGIKMSGEEENFPEHVSGKDLTAIIVSHSHIDHVGGLPIFFISGKVPLYMTSLTLDISMVLLRDMMKISEFYLPFGKEDINKLERYTKFIKYDKKYKVGESTYITLINNGHIPGSAMILVEMDDKTILYTGDMNGVRTQLMNSSLIPDTPIDVLITESTYGNVEHEERKKVEEDFIDNVKRILDNKGRVLVPAFGVSRSQEILMVLNHYKIQQPIYVDGLARRISRIYLSYKNNYFRSWNEFKNAIDHSRLISQSNRFLEREMAKNTNGIVVAPSGMLKGGTARMYAEAVYKDPNSAIFLVSYQLPDSPGAILLNEHKYVLNQKDPTNKESVDCEVKFFDFSSHSGKSQLVNFAQNLNFKNNEKYTFIVHGDKENSNALKDTLNSLNFNASVPKQGDVFKV